MNYIAYRNNETGSVFFNPMRPATEAAKVGDEINGYTVLAIGAEDEIKVFVAANEGPAANLFDQS